MITAERIVLVRFCGPRKSGKELKQRFHWLYCCFNESINLQALNHPVNKKSIRIGLIGNSYYSRAMLKALWNLIK